MTGSVVMNESFPLETVLASLASKKPIDIVGLDTEVLAWLATALHARTDRACVVVVPEESDARRVAADLGFFTDPDRVTMLPLVEASPYGDLSPDRGSVMALLAALSHLAWGQGVWFTVVPAAALARRVIPPDVLVNHSHLVAVGQRLDREACLRALADGGYHAVGSVEDPGTFAVRGGIIDVYVPHLKLPVRIDLFGDEVESLRFFDPETQLTKGPAGDTLVLPPVREEILAGAFRDRARLGIRDAASEAGLPTRAMQPLLDDLANGIPFMGIEGFRPAFFERLDPLFAHLPKDALWLVQDPMATAEKLRNHWEKLSNGYATVREAKLPALPP
jgi:transcription-repair coupling factor (superfamily II helicase)